MEAKILQALCQFRDIVFFTFLNFYRILLQGFSGCHALSQGCGEGNNEQRTFARITGEATDDIRAQNLIRRVALTVFHRASIARGQKHRMFLTHELKQVMIKITCLFLIIKYDHIDTLTPRLHCCNGKANGGRGSLQALTVDGGLAFVNEARECLYLWMFLKSRKECAELHDEERGLLLFFTGERKFLDDRIGLCGRQIILLN